jgi:hypothetical protein
VQVQRDGNATHEQVAHHGCVPRWKESCMSMNWLEGMPPQIADPMTEQMGTPMMKEQMGGPMTEQMGGPMAEHMGRPMAMPVFAGQKLIVVGGQPARFAPGTGNGRGLHDDAFGTTLSLMVGHPLGVTTSPYPVVPEFPHLAPVGHDDIPALADILGLREHPAQPPPG